MADGSTPNYSFVLPEVGASQDTWGAKLNANWVTADTVIDALADVVATKFPTVGGTITGSLQVNSGFNCITNAVIGGVLYANGTVDTTVLYADIVQVVPSFAMYTQDSNRFRITGYDSNDYWVYDSASDVLQFYRGGVMTLNVDPNGPAVSSFQSVLTPEKGDARYIPQSSINVVVNTALLSVVANTRSGFDINVPNAPSGRRRWRVGAGTDRFTIDCASDDFTSFQSAIVIDRAAASVYSQQVRINYEGQIAAAFDPAGTSIVSNKTAVTVEKGDARYQLAVSRRDLKTQLVEEGPPKRIWDIPVYSYKWNRDVMRQDDAFRNRRGYGLMADDVQQVWDVASDGQTLDLRCLVGALWSEVSRLRKVVKRLQVAAGETPDEEV